MAAGDLTTVEKVRTHLGSDSLAADAILAALITSSSAWVRSQVGRPILSATYTETRDGNGRTRMLLDQCPATPDNPPVAVTSVTIDGETIPARPAVSAADTNPAGWVLRQSGVDLVGYTFTKGTANVEIVYSVGYAAVPADLEQAVIEHVVLRYRDRGREGLSSSSAGGEALGFTPGGGTLAYINGVLDLYRAVGVG